MHSIKAHWSGLWLLTYLGLPARIHLSGAPDRGQLTARSSAWPRNLINKGNMTLDLRAYSLVGKAGFSNYGVSRSSFFSASYGHASVVRVRRDLVPSHRFSLSLSCESPELAPQMGALVRIPPSSTRDCAKHLETRGIEVA